MNASKKGTADLAGDFWDADTRRKGAFAGDEAFYRLGTVTEDTAIVRLRDQLEKAHLSRVVSLRPDMRVLDLGGGSGRLALWLAPRVREAVLVDASAEMLKAAQREAGRRGIGNLRVQRGSVLDYEPDGEFDLVLVFGVAAHLRQKEVSRLAEVCSRAVSPAGTVVLKEPVTTDGRERTDQRYDSEGNLVYLVHFRPRRFYTDVFGDLFFKRYQRSTCAHFFPWFVGNTEGAVRRSRSWPGRQALAHLGALWVRIDPLLQDLEDGFRGHKQLARLLAPVDVLQDLYVFDPRPAVVTSPQDGPDLSVVVIAYNEQECIVAVVRELCSTLSAAGIDYEVVLVDDGSVDGTLKLMQDLAAGDGSIRVHHQHNLGIGGALRNGFDRARGRYVTWMPADGQIAPQTIVELYRRRGEGTLLTTVYRSRNDPWYRNAISGSLNWMIRFRTGQAARSGGNYLFERRAWSQYGPRGDDSMMISTGFRQRLREAGETVVEVPIDCRARQAGRSKVLNARTILRTLRSLGAMGRSASRDP